MTLIDEAKNGHAEPVTRVWNARFAKIERRIAEIAETGEHRVAILRDAIGDFCAAELAQRDREIVTLKKHMPTLRTSFSKRRQSTSKFTRSPCALRRRLPDAMKRSVGRQD